VLKRVAPDRSEPAARRQLVIAALLASPATTTDQLDKGSAYLILVGLVATFGVAYWISLHIHPYTKCGVCRGMGRSRGNLFAHAYGLCRRCGGTGRKLRLGVRVFLGKELS
jgi:hypothetical protein